MKKISKWIKGILMIIRYPDIINDMLEVGLLMKRELYVAGCSYGMSGLRMSEWRKELDETESKLDTLLEKVNYDKIDWYTKFGYNTGS